MMSGNNGLMMIRKRSPPTGGMHSVKHQHQHQQLTPSSSPEPGSSPRALACAGWQSLVDESSELLRSLASGAGEEGIRLIEDDCDDEEGDRESEDDDDEVDVFMITSSQKEYYVGQFLNLQPDIGGKVTGSMVKGYFERSNLSTQDLAHIWFLADHDHEGALSVDKWCIAMHLTVLRRNKVDLPNILPPSLLATATTHTKKGSKGSKLLNPHHGHGHGHGRRHTSADVSANIISFHDHEPTKASTETNDSLLIPSLTHSCDPNQQQAVLPDHHHQHVQQQSGNTTTWTKFSDSPTSIPATMSVSDHVTDHLSTSMNTISQDLSSLQLTPNLAAVPAVTAAGHSHMNPKPALEQYHSLDPLILSQSKQTVVPLPQQQQQPANFDFSASSIELDPAILHPIPLRLTPEGKSMLQCLAEHPNTKR